MSLQFKYDRPIVERFIRLVLDPTVGCTELRILRAKRERHNIVKSEYPTTLGGWYDNPKKLADDLHDVKGVSCYLTINPVTSDLLARTDNAIGKIEKGRGTSDSQIVCLRNLFIDFDSKRAPDISATDAEHAGALAARDAFLAAHPLVRDCAAWGSSGNGAWVLVRLDNLPNDALHVHLCHEALKFVGRKFGVTGKVEVDSKTSNPSRVMGCAGTYKTKGSHRPERPWRLATIDSPEFGPDGVSTRERTPLKLADWLRFFDDGKIQFTPTPANVPVAGKFSPTSIPRDPNLAVRIARMLERIGPAISGARGHAKAFEAACALVKGFNLSVSEAMPHMQVWNTTCQPPWESHELLHKLESADAEPDKEARGYFLQGGARDRAEGVGSSRRDAGHPIGDMTFYDESGHPINGADGAGGGAIAPFTGPSSTGLALTGVQDGIPGGPANPPPFCPLRGAVNPDEMPIDTPQEIARRITNQLYWHPETFRIKRWSDEFYEWDGKCYVPIPDGDFNSTVNQWTDRYLTEQYIKQYDEYEKARKEDPDDTKIRPPKKRDVTTTLVNNVIAVMAGLEHVKLDKSACKTQPAWLGDSNWVPTHVLPCMDALVHLPSLARGEVVSISPTPNYFSRYVLNYHFDADSPEPAEWLAFLDSIWPNDPDSIACLQEWIGYLLTPDTSLQKMMQLTGPPRCGKGTITNVIRELIGHENCIMPDIGDLADKFKLAEFVGKQVAIFPDVRVGSKLDKQAVLAKLLGISGEDPQTFDRKYRSDMTMRLQTRFMLISNNSFSLSDNSGALASRFVYLNIKRSFLGEEDHTLLDRLLRELPGILKWAVVGWARIQERLRNGKPPFTRPRSADSLQEEVETKTSPMKSFVKQFLDVVPGHAEPTNNVDPVYHDFMQSYGYVPPQMQFLHDLNGLLGGVVRKKRVALPDEFGNFALNEKKEKVRTMCYVGIKLNTLAERDAIQDEDDEGGNGVVEEKFHWE